MPTAPHGVKPTIICDGGRPSLLPAEWLRRNSASREGLARNPAKEDKPEFRYIMGDFFTGIVALAATDFSVKTNKKILKALIKGRNSRMKDLLSKEQYKVYKARIKERRENLVDFMKQHQGN